MQFLLAGLVAFLMSACYSHPRCPYGHLKNGKCAGKHHHKKHHHRKHGHHYKKHHKHRH